MQKLLLGNLYRTPQILSLLLLTSTLVTLFWACTSRGLPSSLLGSSALRVSQSTHHFHLGSYSPLFTRPFPRWRTRPAIFMTLGREWPSEHCGPLWIHAAAKPPSTDDIVAVEEQLRIQYEMEGIQTPLKFPTAYPTSCLLGCAECIGVISRAQLKALSRDGCLPALLPLENDSSYVFCMAGAKALPLPMSMAGQHKYDSVDAFSWLGLQDFTYPPPCCSPQMKTGDACTSSRNSVLTTRAKWALLFYSHPKLSYFIVVHFWVMHGGFNTEPLSISSVFCYGLVSFSFAHCVVLFRRLYTHMFLTYQSLLNMATQYANEKRRERVPSYERRREYSG